MRPTLLQERPPGKTHESAPTGGGGTQRFTRISADATVDLPPPPPPPSPSPPPERHDEMPVCDFCAKSFASQEMLKRHRETVHRQSGGFSCRVCDRHFYRRDQLKRHHISKHADEEYEAPASYRCPVCQKSFHYRDHLREHLKTHPATTLSPPTSPARRHQRQVCAPMHERVRPSYRSAYQRIAGSAIGTTGLRFSQVNGVESVS